MSELTIFTAARTLQGKEVRQALESRFARLFEDLDGGFTPLNFLFPNLPLPSYRRRDRAHDEMTEFYLDIMRKRSEGDSEVSEISWAARLTRSRTTMTCLPRCRAASTVMARR